MPDRYDTDYRAGQDNLRAYGMDFDRPVFAVSSIFSLIFVISALLFPRRANEVFSACKSFVLENFDWVFVLSANSFLILCVVLFFSPFGKIRIGGAAMRPEFSRLSWMAMLFAAGMGIGLMYWSVAEPVGYYTDWYGTPLDVPPETPAARRLALGATLFHWGLHPWAIYAVVGLTLALFSFNKGLPLTIRSCLFPILKERTWGPVGSAVDIVAVLATLFGLATSLGLGAQQSAAGLNYLFGIANDLPTHLAIIIAVTCLATVSVVRGLDRGVKVLSNINIAMACLLLAFVFVLGPTGAILKSIGESVVTYGLNMFNLSSSASRIDETFYHGWTVFYWAWWISWSPFVGMFIARISKGRTVREFLFAVLLIPTLVTAVWMGTFGGTALRQVRRGEGALANGIDQVDLAFFQMLAELPLAGVASGISVLLVLCFFVTSSDSGSLVIDSITAGGKLEAPVPQRIFWAAMEGLVAIALLVGGGKDALSALQAAAVTVGLPFTFVLLLAGVSLVLVLRHEHQFGSKSTKPISP